MIKTNLTIKEAAEEWVRGFNAIPQTLIEKAYMDNIDSINEVTPIATGDVVYSNELQDQYEVYSIDRENEKITIIDNDDIEVELNIDEVDREDYNYLPMWGTMWTFGESMDDYWLEEQDGLEKMADCGFRIYETDELGYIFGIDGAGYDFYEDHWIPLYQARGLKWHEQDQ